MHYKCLLPLLVIAVFELFPCEASGFSPYNLSTGDTTLVNRYNVSQFATETWNFIKQPTRWDGGDWLTIGVLGGGTFLIMQVDQPIRDLVTKDQRYFRTIPMEAGRLWAETYPPALFFTGFAVHSLLTGDVGSRKIAFEIAQAMLYSGGVRMLSGITFGRARPYSNEGPKSFHPFSSHSPSQDYQSIPGGHCVIGFALSTVLSRNAGPLWLKGLAYVPAALTFVSRIYQDRHWTSDDFIGASIGYFVATWVVDQHEKTFENEGRESQFGIQGFRVQPYFSGDACGLGLSLLL
jgi:membrane-associated phospholipid phosphatase